eukprot:CAMPEP_0174261822 /NCGR_PEP_ID=MMETSP0439-20130205/12373_1 /TAXON_ID=0 /ORGANISM="Stereomyxa ramosa, Strain Chinc5" /LENGTH=559 /DNA_ID=CAMNT_0015346413 /DNA_START=631 /DNA_END=2310 /DNA_ORIENTATION=+
MTYNLGLWGLAKYYLIPFGVYHFWASSFLKTSTLFELLQIDTADLPTISLSYYKYPKWVEFLAGELNYAVSRFPTQLFPNSKEDQEGDGETSDKATVAPFYSYVPFYNLKDTFRYLKECELKQRTEEITIQLREFSFFHLLMSRTGGLYRLKNRDPYIDFSKAHDVIAQQLNDIYWPTTLFLFITPAISLYALATCEYYWQTFLLGFIHYFLGGIGITMGYHRLFAHRAYDAHPIVKYGLLFVGTGCFEMSCIDWSNDHRAHHRYTDTDRDPYSIKKGFWYAHMGWLLEKRKTVPKSDISDLLADPVIRFQHTFFIPLAFLVGIVLPTLIAGLWWGDWWGGMLIAGVLSRVLVMQATFCINSVAHYWGEATYDDSRTPRDSWFVGLFTFGEGYHNFHHEFPYDYRNGAHWRAFDPSKWLIRLLSYFNLTYNLKTFDPDTIYKGVLQMEEKRLMEKKAALHWGPPEETLPTYTKEDVMRLCKEDGETLLIIGDYVHDVRMFIEEHPAGPKFLKPYIGKDATKAFDGVVYNHSNAARNILRTLRIAKFVDADGDASHSHSD